MAGPAKKPRFFATEEQKQFLREEWDKGFRSGKEGDELDRVVARTGCPKSYVKDWVSNQKKPNRGSAYKAKSANPYDNYTAFLALSCPEFDGSRGKMKEMLSKRVAEYNKLKSTAAGLKFLRENRDKMNAAREKDPATRARVHNRALGEYGIIKRSILKLTKLGYKGTALVSQPQKKPTAFGDPEALAFFKDKEELVEEFGDRLAPGKAKPQRDQASWRQTVQTTYNSLFAKACGKEGARVPYQSIVDKKIQVTVKGLPEGIVFQSTKFYSIEDMERIEACKDSITLEIITGTSNLNDILDDQSAHIDDDSDTDPETDSTRPAARDIPSNLSVQSNGSELPNNLDDWSDDDDVPLVQYHEVRLATESDDLPSKQIEKEILPADELPLPTMEESKQKLLKAIKKEKRKIGLSSPKRSQVKPPKRAKKGSGERIAQQFIISKKGQPDERQWYEGTIITQTKKIIVIQYDPPSEEECNFTPDDIEAYKKDGTFIYL